MNNVVRYLENTENAWRKLKAGRVYFEKITSGGVMTYYPDDNTLYLGEDSDEGYEVSLKNLAHFLTLEENL